VWRRAGTCQQPAAGAGRDHKSSSTLEDGPSVAASSSKQHGPVSHLIFCHTQKEAMSSDGLRVSVRCPRHRKRRSARHRAASLYAMPFLLQREAMMDDAALAYSANFTATTILILSSIVSKTKAHSESANTRTHSAQPLRPKERRGKDWITSIWPHCSPPLRSRGRGDRLRLTPFINDPVKFHQRSCYISWRNPFREFRIPHADLTTRCDCPLDSESARRPDRPKYRR